MEKEMGRDQFQLEIVPWPHNVPGFLDEISHEHSHLVPVLAANLDELQNIILKKNSKIIPDILAEILRAIFQERPDFNMINNFIAGNRLWADLPHNFPLINKNCLESVFKYLKKILVKKYFFIKFII
jgi:hypothetical protein